jgi:hypothetical protein
VDITNPEKGVYINNHMVLPFFTPVILGAIDIVADTSEATTHVDFYIDDALQHTDTEAPFMWLWDEKAFFKHTLKVVAHDVSGNTASRDITVWIFNR